MRSLVCLVLASAPLVSQQAARFEVQEATIAQVHEAMRAGRLTCRELVGQYLKRIKAYDKNGPAINSIVVVNASAENEADDLDRRFMQDGLTGSLHCVPVIVKDNFETKGLQTANGALALAGYLPDRDAFQVKRMREAGAIVLAATPETRSAVPLRTRPWWGFAPPWASPVGLGFCPSPTSRISPAR